MGPLWHLFCNPLTTSSPLRLYLLVRISSRSHSLSPQIFRNLISITTSTRSSTLSCPFTSGTPRQKPTRSRNLANLQNLVWSGLRVNFGGALKISLQLPQHTIVSTRNNGIPSLPASTSLTASTFSKLPSQVQFGQVWAACEQQGEPPLTFQPIICFFLPSFPLATSNSKEHPPTSLTASTCAKFHS